MGARRCNAVVILVIALCAGFTGQALAQGTPPSCPASCDVNKLQPVTQVGASTTDIASAVKVTLDTMLGAITKFGGPEIGGVSAGVQGLMDTSFSLWSAWDSVINPQESIKNSLHNDIVKLQDFLVCEVQSIVGAAQSAIEQDMSQEQLNTFNSFVRNTVNSLNQQCGAFNCLNLTSVAPSDRNAMANDNCVVPNSSSDCANVQTWDPMNVITCGPNGMGVCDKGQCWTGISRDGVQAFYRQLDDKFNSGNINNLFGLDQFPADDTEALVLAAKMSLLQVNLYQQLIMLGSAQGENSTLKAFAATAAAKIGERYDYLTDITRIRQMVNTYSTVHNSTWLGGAILNNAYPSNWYSGAWSYDTPDQATFTVKCNWVPGAYPTQGSCWLWQVQYGSYQVASGCEPSKAKPVYQQTENLCFNNRGTTVPGPCAQSFMPYGLTNNMCDFSQVHWPTPGSCKQDSAFQGVWQHQHDTTLVTSFAAAKEALAQELLSNMTAALKDVKGIRDDLVQLSQVGMPAASFDVFATTYPLQKCGDGTTTTTSTGRNAAAASTQFLPGAAALLKASGRPPLPKGAVLAAPTPATAAMASPAPMAADVTSTTVMPSPAPMAAGMGSPAPMATEMGSPAPMVTDMGSPAPMAAVMPSPGPMAADMGSPAPATAAMASPAPMAAGMDSPAPMTTDMGSPAPMVTDMGSPAPMAGVMASPAPAAATKAGGNRKMLL